MATSSSTEDEGKKIGGMFAVNPKKDCPHVQPMVAGIENISKDTQAEADAEAPSKLQASEESSDKDTEAEVEADAPSKSQASEESSDKDHEVGADKSSDPQTSEGESSGKDTEAEVEADAPSKFQASEESSDKDHEVGADKSLDPQTSEGESSGKDHEVGADKSSDPQTSEGESSGKDTEAEVEADAPSKSQASEESSDKDHEVGADKSSDPQTSEGESSGKDTEADADAEAPSKSQASEKSSDKDHEVGADKSSDPQTSEGESSGKDTEADADAEAPSKSQASEESSDKDHEVGADKSSDPQTSEGESSGKDTEADADAEAPSKSQASEESSDKDHKVGADKSSDPQTSEGESSGKDTEADADAEAPSKSQASEESSDKDHKVGADKSSDPHTSEGESSGKDTEAEVEADASSKSQASEESSDKRAPFHLESSLEKEVLLSRIRATIYGNCIGDAIGLLTEFMTKGEAQEIYGTVIEKNLLRFKKSRKHIPIKKLNLEYNMKGNDFHRSRWQVGDWTDDSDQMILILRTLLDHNGKADILDYVQKFKVWTQTGYKELGDFGGMGIGRTTFQVIMKKAFLTNPHEEWVLHGYKELGDQKGHGLGGLTKSVLSHIHFLTEPIKCAYQVWDESGRWAAPNGGVMRTSVLGIQDFSDIPTVIHNTKQICRVTHADPRCIASCVAVTTAIALMLQGKHCKGHGYDERVICEKAYEYACEELKTEEEKEELRRHMFAENLSDLELSGHNKIGYTYKCLGAGFWAYRQKDFRLALTELVMEAGDADTNGAVAGALLGCKLGVEHLPESWLNGLLHKDWLDPQIDRYLVMLGLEEPMKQGDREGTSVHQDGTPSQPRSTSV